MTLPIIQLTDVTVRYGDHRQGDALSGVNLSVDAGDFLAITGPNGGGKTTLLRVILKLLKPTSGKVIYRTAAGAETKRLSIGYLPQKSMIDSRFPITVRETVLSGLLKGLWSRPSASDLERLDEIMRLTGAADFAGRTIGTLSGGQLQRTLLGRALISDPDIIVLDEPLSYVDKSFEEQIYGIVEELSHTKTIILVSHEMTVISGMATRHLIVDRTMHTCPSHHHHYISPCD